LIKLVAIFCILSSSVNQGNDDDGDSDVAPSKLMCHYFGSSDMNKEWTIDMAKDEEILAIACGTGWVRS
jgi:hypothetical protein